MTSSAFPRLVRRSPFAVAAVLLLTALIAVIEVPHAGPTGAIASSAAA